MDNNKPPETPEHHYWSLMDLEQETVYAEIIAGKQFEACNDPDYGAE